MMYVLDTNICIYLIRQRPSSVIQKFQQLPDDSVGISTIVMSELVYGTAKSRRAESNLSALRKLLVSFEIYPFDENAALVYGTLRADLERQGRIIGAMDMLIAAHALSQNLILVTNNEREFSRIPNLRVENWVNTPVG